MRSTILTLAPVLLTATLTAQGVFSNKTQTILEKVIQDYPNHFYNIKGELVRQVRESSEYRSTLQLPGSPACVVTLTGARNEGYSWSCTLLDSENFETAKSRFAEVYGQIRNCIVTTSAQKTFILTGQYEEPGREKKCTRILFSLLPAVGEMKKLKVELVLHQQDNGYRLFLCVNDLDAKEEVQGAVTVN